MAQMKVVVTGGRHLSDVPWIWKTLDLINQHRGPIAFLADGASDDVTGPYIGLDFWAHTWARAAGAQTQRFRADWKKHGRAAGPIRNLQMLEIVRPDFVIAFPGGDGTANLKRQALRRGIDIIEVKVP